MLLAVALAVGDLRAANLREDRVGAVVLPSGAVQLAAYSAADPLAPAPAPAPAPEPAPEPAPAPAPAPATQERAKTPPPTPPPTTLSNAENRIHEIDPNIVEPKPLKPERPWVDPHPGDKKAGFAAKFSDLPVLQHSKPTPTLDDGPAHAARMAAELAYNASHETEVEAALLRQRLAEAAKAEADHLANLTLLEAAGAVVGVLAGEPMRVLTDMESFLLDLKHAIVGPPMHVMREPDGDAAAGMLAGNAAMQRLVALQAAQTGKLTVLQSKQLAGLHRDSRPTGETEYVVSVNGIMEYRPPTAHGAVRVVSVLLLLASAIVLGIGWRYGSAPGMYPYVEDCRL